MGVFKDWLINEDADNDEILNGLKDKYPNATLWCHDPGVIKMIARTKRHQKDGKIACGWLTKELFNDQDRKLISTVRKRMVKSGAYRRSKRNGEGHMSRS